MVLPPASAFITPPQLSVALTKEAIVTFTGKLFVKLTPLTGVSFEELLIV